VTLAAARPLPDAYGVLAERHPAFTRWALFYLALAALTLLGTALDARLLAGVPVWTKPFKFALSIAVYFATLAWLAPLLDSTFWQRWPGRVLTGVPLTCAFLEMLYIVYQAGIGEPSHFNVSTPFNALAYSLMGFGAVLMVGVCLWMGLAILWRWRRDTSPYVLGAGLGLVLTFVLGGGFGGYLAVSGSHWVNAAPTDADGILLFRWARDGGDLRVAHFFGMHVMQVLPLLGFWAGARLPRAAGLGVVLAGALLYGLFTLYTFLQAVAGRPFIA
jgi:hypothetical protein